MARVDDGDSPEAEENDAVEVIIEDEEALDAENFSDDDDSIDETIEKEQAVAVIEEKIAANPYVYEDHVEVINLLSQLSDPHRLDQAYDRLNSWCALVPDQWIHRLHVMRTIAESGFSEEKIKKAHDGFEKAIREVSNHQVYLNWVRFAIDLEDQDPSKVGDYEPRRIISRALDTAGSDPLHGHVFWEKALSYEKKKLDEITPESPEYEDQVNRVFDVYAGWLSKPLLENDGVLAKCEEFVAEHNCLTEADLKEVQDDYALALEILQKILPFEEKLTMFGTTTKAVPIYMEYINRVNELILLGDQSATILKRLLPMLYDRASYECCSLSLNSPEESLGILCETLLSDYAAFARQRGGGRDYMFFVLDSLIKRWPKSCLFYITRMREFERREEGLIQIKLTLELALAAGFPTPEDSSELWMAYLEAVKRHTRFGEPASLERLRANFRLAWDALGRMWGDRADPSCSILLYWARIEYKLANDPVRGRELFEEVFECGANKTLCNNWLEFARLEVGRDPRPPAHKISELFRRALKYVQDWPSGICEAWLNHERDCGTVETLEECRRTCKERMEEWEKGVEERRLGKQKNMEERSNFKKQLKGKNPEARKRSNAGGENSGEGSASKKSKVDSPRKPPKETRLPDSDKNASEATISSTAMDLTPMRPPAAGSNAPPGYKEATEDQNKTDAGSNSDKTNKTVFVSNLGFKVNEKHLREAMASFGEIEDIRIIAGVKAFGGSICYCQYKDPVAVETALSKDRTLLDDRPMFISRYSEDKSGRRPKFQYSTSTEKNKLFVKNLPYDQCTDERLREVFSAQGRLKDVRIVTFRDGKPKGLAYIEYEDEESAAAALKATNGMRLGEHDIIVAFSAPPPKSGNLGANETSLGEGRRDTTAATKGRGKGRTQLSAFLPRVLQKPTASVGNGNASSGGTQDKSATLSNSDFREMLLGKK